MRTRREPTKNHQAAHAAPPCITRSLFHTVYAQKPLTCTTNPPRRSAPPTATFTYCHNKNQPQTRDTTPDKTDPETTRQPHPSSRNELEHTTLPARTFTPEYQRKAPEPPRFMHSSHHTAPIDAGTIENPVTKTQDKTTQKGHATQEDRHTGDDHSPRRNRRRTPPQGRQNQPYSSWRHPRPHVPTLIHTPPRGQPPHHRTSTPGQPGPTTPQADT